MSGQGTLTYKEGFGVGGRAVYTGSFRHNKRDGFGDLAWGNPKSADEGERYRGLWHNDKRVKGWTRMADGTEYDGEWKGDMMHGWGKLTFKASNKGEQGVVYEGRFDEGIQATEGKLYYPNGDLY